MMEVTLKGQFAVSGKNNAVEVYLFDEDDYTNWLYGNDSIALYDSGRRTMGEIQARIVKSGRYFLILQKLHVAGCDERQGGHQDAIRDGHNSIMIRIDFSSASGRKIIRARPDCRG